MGDFFENVGQKLSGGKASDAALDFIANALKTINEIDNELKNRGAGYTVESFSVNLSLSPTISVNFKKVK